MHCVAGDGREKHKKAEYKKFAVRMIRKKRLRIASNGEGIKMRPDWICLTSLVLFCGGLTVLSAEPPPIVRVLPPAGMELPKDEQDKLEKRIEKIRDLTLAKEKQGKFTLSVAQDADIEIFLLAVELALEFHEFYDP